ncbi:MAG: SDR family oxidoreductase [Caldilineaceae bacterium]|nr:SDR family oxidoreductase [Caldilineaceae bacterium]HRJ41342.1 SDR family oxidoreductase [Caldilineaceae bacterium]
MNRYTGKIALITGSSSGIGRGIALALAGEGADVVINHLSDGGRAEETAQAIRGLGRRALVVGADVARREEVAELFSAALDAFGRVDVVVANAAFSIRELTVDAAWENVEAVVGVAQFGVYHTCQMAAQQMIRQQQAGRPGGKILVTGSILAQIPFPTSGAYNMAKAAVNHFARTLAAELLPQRINVNIINPGWIDTPGERRYTSDAEIAEAAGRMPWGRMGTPEDIGKAAAFLCSEDADYITGTALTVDGGYLLGMRLA